MSDRQQRGQARARRKLAKLELKQPKRVADIHPGPHGNFSLKQRQAIRDAYDALRHPAKPKSKPKAKPYNPLTPLTGKAFNKEVNAETKQEFAPQFADVNQQIKNQDTHTALVGSAYDAYKAALDKALASTTAAYTAAKTDADTRLTNAYNQDVASAQTPEGQQAAAAERALSNNALTNLSTSGAAATDNGNTNSANSLLAKTEALRRESDTRGQLVKQRSQLKQQRGAYKTTARQKLRSNEQTYALARKEFGLKVKTENDQASNDRAQIKATKGQGNAQVLIAKLYASADRAKARATIRVAKLQLQKGKIDQSQYRKIINVYRGLPKPGKSPTAGKHPRFSNTQQAQVDHAVGNLESHTASLNDRSSAIEAMVRNGLSRAQANAAWRTYVKKNHLTNGQQFPKNQR